MQLAIERCDLDAETKRICVSSICFNYSFFPRARLTSLSNSVCAQCRTEICSLNPMPQPTSGKCLNWLRLGIFPAKRHASKILKVIAVALTSRADNPTRLQTLHLCTHKAFHCKQRAAIFILSSSKHTACHFKPSLSPSSTVLQAMISLEELTAKLLDFEDATSINSHAKGNSRARPLRTSSPSKNWASRHGPLARRAEL